MERNIDHNEKIKQLYLEMYDLLIAYAYGILNNYAVAEEAVQETFRIACSKPEALLSSKNSKGWLTITLKNVIQNMRRSRFRFNQLLVEVYQSNQWESDGRDDEVNVDILYSNLAEDPNFILLKKIALEQKTILEVANELGISVEACAKRIQRAKKSLRRKLSEE